MGKGKKRERNVNFIREETAKLVSLVEAKKNIIENKKSDAVTWQEKDKAWKDIEKEFNSSGVGVFRDAKHLKLKYHALKRDTRKKCSLIRAEHYKTSGGTSEATPLTPGEQKLKDMILLAGIYDSEQLEVTASKESTAETAAQTVDLAGPLFDTVGCEPKEKRPFDKLAEAKIEMVVLQQKLIEEELEAKILRKQILKQEMQHKKEMYELEHQQMVLKLEILKRELQNK